MGQMISKYEGYFWDIDIKYMAVSQLDHTVCTRLTKEVRMHLTTLLMAVLVLATEEFPGAVFVIDALMTVFVWATNEILGAVFVIDTLVAVLV